MDQHYNGLRSLQADFTEIYKGAGIERTESGTLWLKKPGKMRWEYRSPKEKLLSRRQERVALYSGPAAGTKNGAEKAGGFALAHRIPLREKQSYERVRRTFAATDQVAGDIWQHGFAGRSKSHGPARGGGSARSQPQNQIVRISVTEGDGSLTEYHFRNLTENGTFGDDAFRFAPPNGVETIQGDLGQ